MIDSQALAGRRFLVTGGNRGIGAACVRLFHVAGAEVWLHYYQGGQEAAALVAELSEGLAVDGEPGQEPPASRIHASSADLSRSRQVKRLFEEIRGAWPSLDGLVANAGVWWPTPMDSFDLESYQRLMAINVDGVFQCVDGALPMLRASQAAQAADTPSSIVTITSTAAQRGEPGYSAYAASKGALLSATKAWATELAPEIRVNSVAPGWVDTDMSREALAGEQGTRAMQEIPLRRVATAEDIANAVLFLSSPMARQITGEILNVNGGSVLAG